MFRLRDLTNRSLTMAESSAMAAMNSQAAVSSSSINSTETKEREEKHQQINPDKVTIKLSLDTFKCKLTKNFFLNAIELGCGHVFESSALTDGPFSHCPTCHASSNSLSITPVRNIIFWEAYKQIFNQYPQLNKSRHFDLSDLYQILFKRNPTALKLNDIKLRLNQYAQLFINEPDLIFQQGSIPHYAKSVNAAYLLTNFPQGKQLLDNYPQLKALIKTGSRNGIVLAINPMNKDAAKLIEYVKSREIKQEVSEVVPQVINVEFLLGDFQCPITQEVMLEPFELDCGHMAEKSHIEKMSELKDNQSPQEYYNYTSQKCCPQCRVDYKNPKTPNVIVKHIISSAFVQNPKVGNECYYDFKDFTNALDEYKPSAGALPRLSAYVELFAKSPQLLHKAKNEDDHTFAKLIVKHRNGSAFLNAHSDLKKSFVQQLSFFANPFDSNDDERIERFKSAVTSLRVKQ